MHEKVNYEWPVTSENAVVYNYFLQKIQDIKDVLTDKRIVIFGAGIRGCCLLKILQNKGFCNIIFVDNNMQKQGNLIRNYDILSLEEALKYPKEQVFLVSPEGGHQIYNQLEAVGLRENRDWFSFSVSTYDYYVEEYQRPVKDHLLAMGDCAFTHIALEDSNSDSLGTMIRSRAGTNRCKILDMHGMGQQAYYHISRSLLERGEKPSVFLLLLVLETMPPKAPIMPRTQHPELIWELVRVSKSENTEFIQYAKVAQERFDRFQVESFVSFSDVKKSSQQKEKLYMQANYLFKFSETTEGVIYLKKTIKMMNEKSIPVVLYVPPVNYIQGEDLFGTNFKKRYEENFNRLYETLDKDNLRYEVADASYLLSEDDFAAHNTIDETCNYNGRKKLMEYLSGFTRLKPYLSV